MITPIVMIFAIGLFSACDDGDTDTDTDVCDEYEAFDYDDDCGYWGSDISGATVWVWYTWVTPWVGGTPPAGMKPAPPAGVKPAPPKNKPAPPPGVKPPAPKPPVNKPPAGGPAKPPPPRPPGKVGK
jgi:hypothetical protein